GRAVGKRVGVRRSRVQQPASGQSGKERDSDAAYVRLREVTSARHEPPFAVGRFAQANRRTPTALELSSVLTSVSDYVSDIYVGDRADVVTRAFHLLGVVEEAVEDERVHVAVAVAMERVGDAADDGEAELLVEVHRARVRGHDEVELHGAIAVLARSGQR